MLEVLDVLGALPNRAFDAGAVVVFFCPILAKMLGVAVPDEGPDTMGGVLLTAPKRFPVGVEVPLVCWAGLDGLEKKLGALVPLGGVELLPRPDPPVAAKAIS